jgi:hypothetical protein
MFTDEVVIRANGINRFLSPLIVRYPSGEVRVHIGKHFPYEQDVISTIIHSGSIYALQDEEPDRFNEMIKLLNQHGIRNDSSAIEWLDRFNQRVCGLRRRVRADPIKYLMREVDLLVIT